MKVSKALAVALLIVPVATIPAGASGHHRTYENDDCRSIRHRDEAGFVWWEHRGTEEADVCLGTEKMDIFWMKSGGDFVSGLGGNDQIHLGSGFDTAYGNKGRDRIWGGAHHDEMHGGPGKDVFYDRTPRDSMDWDQIWGGRGSDWADIEDGDIEDEFYGQQGVDREPRVDHFCMNYPCDEDFVDMGN